MDSTGMLELLVVLLAVVAVVMVIRKRYHSNLPLLFYLAALVFTNATDRNVNPYLMYSGLTFALLLRFEFMGVGFSKFIAFMTSGALCLVAWIMISDVIG
ncbi:MAG TPA: hypothetical protein VN841_14690 [Bryobacteraceae bacterium]|nr:hypothetical protein [Bryobacteraceae bacterium]